MTKKSVFTTLLAFSMLFVSLSGSASATNLRDETQLDAVTGPPGTVFRYVRTYGETGVPYYPDTAHINFPEGVAVDSAGNVWVAETWGDRVLKYSGSGAFLMAIDTYGLYQNRFCDPSDVAVDGSGNIWVVDRCAGVFQYDPAGNYIKELENMWDAPIGVALDSAGRIYVSEENKHHVQVYDSSGALVATIGETGAPGDDNAHFTNPYRIAVDADDVLYVADMNNHRVQIFDDEHFYIATLGVTGEPGSDNAHLAWPRGVAVSANYIFVTDGNPRVQVFNRATRAYVTTLGGSWGSGNAQFNPPLDVAADAAGNVYVSDAWNHRVQKYNSSFTFALTIGTTGVPYLGDDAHFNAPYSVAVSPDGNIGVVDTWGNRFILLDAGGTALSVTGEAGVVGRDNLHLANPQGADFGPDGKIYVADSWNTRIQILNADGSYHSTLSFGTGTGDYEFSETRKIAVGGDGSLYISDYWNHRVQIYDSSFTYKATLGVTGEPGSGNTHFNYPSDIAVDAHGNIYVADSENHRVQKFNSSLEWQMTLGVSGECGEEFTHFCGPFGVSVDRQGRIFVADMNNSRIQVFSASGAYLTTIGGGYSGKPGDLFSPNDVDVDATGRVFVADTNNHRIQMFAPGVPGWAQVNINGFGERHSLAVHALEVFSGMLYAGVSDWENGGRIWRSGDAASWTAVSEPGFGSGSSPNAAVTDLITFKGQLYASTSWGAGQGQIWRTADGAAWTQVVGNGFGSPDNNGIARFMVFGDQLYASVFFTPETGAGAEIWRSISGNPSSWQRVVVNGAGNPNNSYVNTFAVFNGSLFAGAENPAQGAVVWSSTNGGAWQVASTHGFGEPANIHIGSLTVFKDMLYAGTRNDETGAQLWRSSSGASWSKVMGNGFGDTENYKIESLYLFEGSLYAVTNHWTTGVEVWRSSDGTTWTQVNPDGFGDSTNITTLWNSATIEFKNHLYIGTSNDAQGGELWKMLKNQIFMPIVRRGSP